MSETNKTTSNEVIAIVTGIQIGEESKGAAVEWLTQELNAHTVIRNGGCQAGHHIVTKDGKEQQFSHFGCGTFEEAQTYLRDMVIEPVRLFEEALELEAKGISDPFSVVTIDENCISITPFHGALSRLKEISRGDNKKGTIGMGVGDAVKDSLQRPHLTIRAKDFSHSNTELEAKVEAIRQTKLEEARLLLSTSEHLQLLESVRTEVELLEDKSMVATVVNSFHYLAELVKIVDQNHMDEILQKKGAIVTEPSHGALLHPFAFPPHTTQVDPTSKDLISDLKERSHNKQIIRLGVGRSYMTRHGAGPLMSFDRKMTDEIQETHNAANGWANEWLGEFRVGHYDLIATKYALEIAGGPKSFDGLMISFLDVITKQDKWGVVESYTYEGEATDLNLFFNLDDSNKIVGIKPHPDTRDKAHMDHQLRLTELLKDCKPVVSYLYPTAGKSLETVFLEYVETNTSIPVVAISRGPKAEDREKTPAWDQLFKSHETDHLAPSNIIQPLGVELSLTGSHSPSNLPENIASNPKLLEQAQFRRELSQTMRQIFNLCKGNNVWHSLHEGLISETQLHSLYQQLNQLLQSDEDHSRLLLYLPFEILPDMINIVEVSPALNQSMLEFVEVYRQGWLRLLHESEPRASFVDGDIHELGMEEPERIRKAAHLIPELMKVGIIDTPFLLDLYNELMDSELQKSLSDGIIAARNQELISDESWNLLAKFYLQTIKTNIPTTAVDYPISPERVKWLKTIELDKAIEESSHLLSQKISTGEINIDELKPELVDVGALRGIFLAAENVSTVDYLRAEAICNQAARLLKSLRREGPIKIQDEIANGLNRWHKLNLISDKTLEAYDVLPVDLSLSLPISTDKLLSEHRDMLKRASEKIATHPELSKYLYPFFLVFGSRIKGYATSNPDLDLAIMFKPDVDFTHRKSILKTLLAEIPELSAVDKILEFWTTRKEDQISLRPAEVEVSNMVSAPQIHFILGSAIIGDNDQAKTIMSELLLKYLDLSRFGDQKNQVRAHLIRQIELDILQYRLMHKGYRKFHSVRRRPSFNQSELINYESDFWDSGYRQTASLLYLSRVFLPDLS